MHDGFGDALLALLKFVIEGYRWILRVDECSNTLEYFYGSQLLDRPIREFDIVKRKLLPVHFHADIVIRQPARRGVENILVGFERSQQHPKEGRCKEQAEEDDESMA
jgi:hypothetical protein